MIIKADISNPTLVKNFVSFLCVELDVYPSSIMIADCELENGTLGLCLDQSDDEFIILVKEKNRNIGEIFTTIAHEMIHVKQYMKENLSHWLHTRNDIPYLERWWEKEAFGNAVPLVEKFTKTLKNI